MNQADYTYNQKDYKIDFKNRTERIWTDVVGKTVWDVTFSYYRRPRNSVSQSKEDDRRWQEQNRKQWVTPEKTACYWTNIKKKIKVQVLLQKCHKH